MFTLKFDLALERFDDTEVQDFVKDKEVLSVRDHFFTKQDTPYLLLIVKYLPGSADSSTGKKPREAWRDLLTNEQMPLFDSLREWRSERAKREGVPPYFICTNRELAQIVAARPQTLAGLAKIQGIGKAKLDKYGQELLPLLRPPGDSSALQEATAGAADSHMETPAHD